MASKKWNKDKVEALYNLPFTELLFQACYIHRKNFKNDEVQLCTLLNIKTGSCPENCAYCSQSSHYKTNIIKENLLDLEQVVMQATIAKQTGATRFCMGAAWRKPNNKDLPKVAEMIKAVKNIGLQTCVTLGMLNEEQALELKACGLDFYNHNLDTSPKYYKEIITTRTYQDRLDTLEHVRKAGINVCCGGIIGLGESKEDRIELLLQLANLPQYPESVPINRLIPIQGTPLAQTPKIDDFEFIRTIATARIMMPKAMVRLSAGRNDMSETMQALCFLAGANSIWLGDKLLTTPNPEKNQDMAMLDKLGIKASRLEYAQS